MFSFLNLVYGGITFILLFIVYVGYKYFLKPYRLLQFYKKQGLSTSFYPIMGDLAENFANVEKHGDSFYGHKQKALLNPRPKAWAFNFGDTAFVQLKDNELLKNFFINQEAYYEKNIPTMPFLKELTGDGILLSAGSIWKKHRKVASAAFNFEYLTEMIPEVVRIADECLEGVRKMDMNKFDVLEEMQVMTGDIGGRLFLGTKFGEFQVDGRSLPKCLIDFLVEIGDEGQKPLNAFLGGNVCRKGYLPSHRKILDRIKKMRKIIENLTIEKMEGAKEQKADKNGRKRVDLVELFYKQRTQNPQEAFTQDQLVDDFVTFFVAGTETAGHVLTMATYFLLKNPHTKEKIMEEINKYFNDLSSISVETLNKMDYVTAFIKETMRVSPVDGALFDRIATQDHDLGGLKIKKGTLVNCSFLSNNFDADYHVDPYKFDPERWLDETKTTESVRKYPYIYTPFSAGIRNCLGQHLGMHLTRIIFCLFVKKYDFEITDKNYVLKMTQRSLYEPQDPFYLKLHAK